MSNNVEVFARKASGLTREAGMLDTTYFAIMNNAVPVSIWFVIGAYSWLPGANLTLACIITLICVVFGFAMVWGILGGSMPRSGGSYVYNSRIIHPIIGLGVSFCNGGFVMLAWIWVQPRGWAKSVYRLWRGAWASTRPRLNTLPQDSGFISSPRL